MVFEPSGEVALVGVTGHVCNLNQRVLAQAQQ